VYIATSSRAEGVGTRFFWGDLLPGGGNLSPPFIVVSRFIYARPQNHGAADYAVGFSAYPSRWPDAPVRQIPRANRIRITVIHQDDNSVFQIVKEQRAAEAGQLGGFTAPKRENPGSAL
jgi:hypothetical protein